jgi:hypothetical protein
VIALIVAAAAAQLVFDVSAGDRRIGEHRYEITEDAQGIRLAALADMRVTILRVPVFTYRHEVNERWRDGCLVELHSTTKSQGDEWRVDGQLDNGVFVVERLFNETRERESLDECTASFAYWDPAILVGRSKLLNGQTGEYEPLDVNITEGTAETPRRIRLVAAKFTIDLDYRDAQWVGLESLTGDDQRLLYRPKKR